MLRSSTDGRLVRVAVFFDGGYFDEVSRYYKFQHPRKARLDLLGVQEFIRHAVAEREKREVGQCQIVEAHWFRGRFSTDAALQAGKLEDERRFDEVLMRAGIVQHYLPLDEKLAGRPKEKGIDVWLALEAFDLAIHKGFDVVALLTSDSDYVPLVRKLNGIGTRVMLLAWDFQYEYTDAQGMVRKRETRTSSELIRVCTYPIMMNSVIDDRSRQGDPIIEGLFLPQGPGA